MTANIRFLNGTFFGALFVALIAACNPVKFSAIDNQVPAGPAATGPTPAPSPSCPGTIDQIYRLTKILFLVDSSGSNAQATWWPGVPGCEGGAPCVPATDPLKKFRGGAIADFLGRYRYKTNFNWGFATFADSSAHAFINTGFDQQPIFATNPDALNGALNTFYSIQDGGATPYAAAFDMAKKAIVADPDLMSPAKPHYIVILLSDGFPTDYLDQSGNFNQTALMNDVKTLVALAPDQVSLSTIFYGQVAIPQATGLLQSIAAAGRGQFATVNTASTGFKIDDVIPSSALPCQK